MKRIAIAMAAAVAMMGGLALAADPARAQAPNPADFSTAITHPLFPLSSLGPKIFDGQETDADTGETIKTRLESRVLPQTTVVAGVTVLVLEEKAYADGELIEVALDYFAQHRDGSVYYFGELVDNYENGAIKNHDGQWLAGEGQNVAGIIMPVTPKVGETYAQEHAPGVAEDQATVVSTSEKVKVPTGTYTGCLKTRDFSPLDPGVEEFKFYCPGVGMVKEEGDGSVLELTSLGPAPSTTPVATAPAATVAAPARPAATAPTQVTAPRTGDGGAAPAGSAPPAAAAVAIVLAGLGSVGLLAGRRARR